MFILLISLYLFLWFVLYDFYSIFTHYTIPLFTLCRIPDKFFFNIIIFTFLPLIYILNYFILRRYKEIPFAVNIILLCSFTISSLFSILTYPIGAPDIFNYIISCKTAYYHHLNPYLHTFGSFTTDPLINYSNTVNMTLGYGPAWLMLSYIPFIFSGFNSIVSMLLWYKIFNVLFLIGISILIYHYEERDKKWVSLYLFIGNPLVLFEGVLNGHNDLMMAFFLIFSIFKLRKHSIYALPLLTASAMIKFFTLPLIPLYLMEMIRSKWKLKKIILTCLLSLLLLIITFTPFWDKGNMLQGLFNGMNSYHKTDGISIPAIVRQYMEIKKIKGFFYVKSMFTGIFIVFTIIEILYIKGRFEDRIIDILLFFLITISLFYPWHLITVLAVLSMSVNKWHINYLLFATFSGMFFYPLSVLLWGFSGLSDFSVYFCLSLFMIVPVYIFFTGNKRTDRITCCHNIRRVL